LYEYIQNDLPRHYAGAPNNPRLDDAAGLTLSRPTPRTWDKYDFFTRVQTPALAAEITLQPVDQTDVDAVIIFQISWW
jgi:hypothetical protein